MSGAAGVGGEVEVDGHAGANSRIPSTLKPQTSTLQPLPYTQELGASFVVVRVGKMSQDDNLANVRMEPGDELSAEVTASSAAEVVNPKQVPQNS